MPNATLVRSPISPAASHGVGRGEARDAYCRPRREDLGDAGLRGRGRTVDPQHQPWPFRLDPDTLTLEIRAATQRGLRHIDPTGRPLHVSVGCSSGALRLGTSDAAAPAPRQPIPLLGAAVAQRCDHRTHRSRARGRGPPTASFSSPGRQSTATPPMRTGPWIAAAGWQKQTALARA